MTGQIIAGEIFTRIKYVSPSFYGVGSFSSTQKRKHLGLIILNQVDQLSNYVLRPLEHQKKRAQGFKRKKKGTCVQLWVYWPITLHVSFLPSKFQNTQWSSYKFWDWGRGNNRFKNMTHTQIHLRKITRDFRNTLVCLCISCHWGIPMQTLQYHTYQPLLNCMKTWSRKETNIKKSKSKKIQSKEVI